MRAVLNHVPRRAEFEQPARREGAALRRCAFGLAMLASAAAGAAVTLALWGKDPEPAPLRPRPGERSEATASIANRAGPSNHERMAVAPREPSVSTAAASPAIAVPAVKAVQTIAFRRPAEEPRAVDVAATGSIPSDRVSNAEGVKSVRTVVFRRPEDPRPVQTAALGPVTMSPSLQAGAVKSWRYQLQNVNPAEVARLPDDLVVIDYGGSSGAFSKAEVAAMRRKPSGARRMVLAYLSIGEAEDYRFYWKGAWRSQPPAWLGKENPSWRSNYAVRFWDEAWQDIVFDYADRIVAAGFDGLYLDKVDAFETMGRPEAMVDFVARIAARVKAQRSDALVISQNGDALLANQTFRNAIDGFAREDLFYGEDRDGARNAPEAVRASVARLKRFAGEGKPVFVVEYPRTGDEAQSVRREIAAQGFIGLTARRELDAL